MQICLPTDKYQYSPWINFILQKWFNSKKFQTLQFCVESNSCLLFQDIRILQFPNCPRYFEYKSCSVFQDI